MEGLQFSRNQKLAILALVGLIVIGASIRLARNASSPLYKGVTVTEPVRADGVTVSATDSDTPGPGAGTVTFQMAGAVVAPNVYTLPRGSRIIDAIKAAGGTRTDADTGTLNLAARIEDGSQIFIPSSQQKETGQQARVTTGTNVPSTAAATAAAQPDHVKINIVPSKSGSSSSAEGGKLRNPGDGVVRINSADVDELQRLPGVGPSTAQKILDYRNQVGKFSSVDQLDDVKGIGPAKLEKMRPFISL